MGSACNKENAEGQTVLPQSNQMPKKNTNNLPATGVANETEPVATQLKETEPAANQE